MEQEDVVRSSIDAEQVNSSINREEAAQNDEEVRGSRKSIGELEKSLSMESIVEDAYGISNLSEKSKIKSKKKEEKDLMVNNSRSIE